MRGEGLVSNTSFCCHVTCAVFVICPFCVLFYAQLCLVLCLPVELEEGSSSSAGLCISFWPSVLVLQPHHIPFRALGVYL